MKNLSILKIFFGIIFTTLSYFNEISAQTIFEKEAQIRDSLFNLYIDADWCHTSKIPQNQKEPENFNDNRISLFKPHNFRGNSRNSTWNYTQGYGSTCENDCVMAAPIVCSNSSNSKFRIPVVFTVSTTVGCAGNAAPTQAEVDAQLAIMNDLYACEATPIEFYKSVSYTGHPSSGDMSTRFLNLGCIYDENNVSNIPGVTNIYVFSNTGNGTGCNGYAFLPSGPTAPMTAVMSNACFTGFVYTSGSLNCAAPSLGSGVVLIHEMGHYLGLEHTHGSYVPGPNVNYPGNGGNNTATNNYYGDISTELVNGSNGCTTGDHISDTPADLGISHSIDPQGSPSGTPPVVPNPVGGCATRSGCNITFTCQDANSQIYMPAANNIMNYNNISGCRTNYSDCQNAKMLDALICARGPQFCDRNVVAEFGSNPTTYNICIGDAAPTFTATSNCYKWMDGLGDAATQLATGTTTFTPAIGTGSGQLNNMLPGTYTWYLGDVNELNPNCRTPITVVVSAETGTATINNSSSANICGSQNINLATDVSVLGTNQIIGWWFSGSPLPSFSNQTSLDNAVAAATIGGPLSFPLNHIIASTSGSPLNQLTQSFDCSGLNGNTYYVTPIVATQNVPAPTSYSFALNGQSNISSTVNNLPVNVSQLPTNATLTSVCVQISYNACEVFATHNDLDISLMGPNGMTIVLEDFFAGSTNVPTPSTFDVCFVDNGTGYTGASSTGCNASCFSGNLESASSFSSFDGVNPNGTWTLIVNDDFNASFYPCNISVSLNFDMPSYALTFPSPVYTNCVIGSPVTVNCLCASCPTLTSAPANVTIMNSACSTGCTVSGGSITAPSGTPCPTGSTLEYRVNGGAWSTTLPVYAQTGPAQTIETRCVCDTDNTMFSPSSAAMTTVPGTCTNPTAAITVAETSGTTNNDGNICAGASATLTASGGTSYIWSTAATTAGISVTPTGTTTYTVTVTNTNGCTDTEVTTITVNPLPTAAIAVAETSGTTNNDGTICAGASATLAASGGTSYIWSTAATTAGISVTPTGTTTYTVTVTNTNGCTDTKVTTITVNPLPTAAIAVAETSGTTNNDGTICAGASATLTASGGTSYIWSTAATTAGISVTPTGTTTYTVTVTNTNGCTDTEVTTITVNPLPTAAIAVAETSGTTNNDGIICAGATSTLTASGGTSYIWSTTATAAGISVTPTGTTTYTVTVTNTNGCTDTEVTTITVNPLPATPTITITNNVCPSTIGTISATGCGAGTLEWATNAGGPWSTTVPTYTTSVFTVYARCVENGCIGATANATTAPIMCVSNDCQNIFISEYVEGTSNNKAIEIYNPTASTITLTSNASIKIYFNGATTATTTISLSGTIPAYGVFVLANSSANATILAEADQTSGSLTFNGDDAIELVFMTASVDVIGQIGVDPGTEWGTGLTSTADNTLRRKASIKLGDSVGSNSFDPAIEWDGYATDTFGGLGTHSSDCQSCPILSAQPANVSVTNSTCDATCTVSGGLISAPSGTPCPLGSTLQYSVNGGTWSTTLPVYAQTGPVQSIETRCLCDLDGTTVSPVSSPVITAPGTCTLPTQPTITIVNNVCPSTIGTISATGCGSGTTLEWATNAAGPWSTVIPTYTTSPLTVYARCRDNITNCVSPSASSTTAPVSCGAFSFTISDPCSCNNDATLAGNDGTFNEVITVTGPTGFTLTATCVGCTPSTLSFTEGPAGTYVSNTFTHVDNVGYTAQIFANGSGVGSISNICAYPNVAVNPIGPFTDCEGQAAVPLTATIVGDNGSGNFAWTGTGVTGSTFNPSGLDPGIVVVSLNYTGVNLGNISPDGVTPAYPGCIQPDTIQVRITQAVAPPVISNITVCEGENTTLSVSSTSGPGPEETFTAGWIFDTEVTSGTASGLGAGDISVVNASTGSGLGNPTFPGGNPPSAFDSYSANNWTSNSFPDANDYFEFCLNATGGYQIDLSSFSFDGYRSNTGPANAQISISINGAPFANIGAPISIPTGFGSNPMFTIPLAVSNATSICIRISGYSASAASTAGTFRVDNVSFIGQGQLIIGPPTGTYNFYSQDPTINPTSVPVFVGNSYDPGTTAATSPDTIWVTCVDQLTGCESAPDTVIVIVNPNPVLAIVQPSPACIPSTVNVLNVALGESPAGGTISYHATMADAEGDVNPITSGLDAVSVTTTIFVRYELANGCFIVGQINVVINAMPPPPTVPSTISVCSGGSTLITVDTNPVTVTTTWDFESGIAGQGISSNMVVAGNGATQTAGSGLGSVGTQAAGSGCTAAITSTAYDITNASLADAIADNEYFEFCIGAPMAGFVFNGVTGINWNHRISGTGPISWALVAAGSPNTPLLSGSIAGTSCVGAGGTIALNPSTCYRVYYWGATNVSGTLRIDNFNILAQYQNLAIYNWFNVNPDTNPEAIPVATGNSYDPMTTAATSPQTVWVNCNNGCVSTASQVVINAGITPTVNAVPNQALCPGASTTSVTFSGTPTGVTFGWTNNNTSIGLAASGSGNISSFVAVNATTINQVATITVTPSYTSGGVTCMGTPFVFTITVYANPLAAIAITETSGLAPNDGIICQGAMATLTASGGGTYVWSNGATTAGITTGTAGTYSVTVTSVNGCTAATSSSITVLPLPTPSISVSETSGTVANDGTIYTGSSANLTASGGGTYLWNTGATTAGITVTPSTTTTYTVTVTNANNCSATASTTITVVDPPCLLVCSGDQTITLTNGACEYQLPNLVTGAGVCDFFTIEQVSGPEPGDLLPRGSYDITYQLVSNLGEIIDECTFTVVVRANPVVVNSLTCNDHINISADINCEVTLSPDMFLEGNSYSCYADYQINIWPFNSQANAINNVPQNEGINLPTGEHTYEIVGPSGNRCWGTFTIEDKLAPVVECNCSGPVADVSAFREIGVFGNKKYYLSNATYTWQQAYAHAQSVGGEMLCITSAAENAFILNTWSIPGFASQRTWLGATDNEAYGGTEANNTNNGWVWVSGEPFSYTNWASGEPNGLANEDYVEMFGAGGTEPGRWNDNTNTFGPLRYIMEVENCSYNCYDLAVIQNETVPMLYGVSPNKSVLTTPPTATDGCGPVSATFTDAINGGDQCDTRELVRSWTFEDASGNKSYCTQRFAFEPISVTDLIPPVREVHLTCGLDATPAAIAGYLDVDSRTQPANATNIGAYADDYAQTGSVVELHEGYANGYFTYNQIGYDGKLHAQKVDNNVCNLYTTYTDDVIPACGIGCSGNMKVIRNWKLLDWCTGEVFTYTQVIKATDEKAPTFTVKNATVGVDPWGCAANWNVGQPWELADNCAKAEEIKWGVKVPSGVTLSGTAPNYRITGLTKGTHKITYWASDCCGNVSEKDAYVTVIDASAPVAVAKQNIVMSLTGSGTGADGAGKIYGWQIDNGSYDHCSDVRFEVRRVDGGSCGNVGANGTHNNNSTYNDNNGYPSEVPGAVWFHPQDNAQDTDGGEFVKFCCEDIPAGADYGLHDVELRVWDDGNMNGVIGDNDIINGMKDNYNTTWVTIRVENKLPPALVCPPDVTITCDMELNLSLDSETNVNDVNLTMTGYPQAYDLCSNLQVTYKDQWVGSHDPVCKSGTVRRTFKVTKGAVVVTCAQFITVATLTAPFTVTFPNQNQTTEWDKCSFTLDDARDAANASIKRPIVNYGQCDIVGENITIDTFLFEDGACKKWRVKYSYKNWCTGEEINTIAGLPIVHWYAFKDVTAPVLSCTNQMFAANPNPQNPNGGCEAAVALEASASDKLICAEESWIKWQMFFDGWNDGTVDRLGSSFVNKSWNGIWVPQAKYIANVLNPTWVALQDQHPNLPLADLVYVTYIKPTAASGGTAKLPVGTGATAFILNAENISHKVLWKVTDGCGNVDQCESTVMVVDKKAPTPYCVSVSTALMQTNPQMVELWARDFDKGAFDNCTPQSKLYFTFDGAAPIYSRVNDEHYYKVVGGVSVNATAAEYAQGKAYRWLPTSRSAGFVWTTAGDFNVQVSVWDEAWNTDYCTVVLSVRGGNGSTPSSRVSGTVATISGQGVNNVSITFDANMSEYPKTVQTAANGTFDMSNYNGLTYEITASKGGDYLNGVSTLDLVMIQRHILGLQALDSNYKMIAADANKDGKVTASDLTDLRKLILGVTTTLPNNTSWRFAVAGTPVQTSPIAFTEAISITNLSSDMDNQNFVAVKIGDVNGNVSTSVNSPEVESRSNANVEMSVAEASIAAGEVVEIPVTAANFSEVSGFQYTMNLNGASFVGVQSGVLEVNANNVGVISDNVVTMSYASTEAVNANEGAVLFTLTVKADKAMKVSEMISLNSEVTRAESYNSDLKVGKVSLGVRTAPVAGIELFQNEPNPFKGMTTVSFEMPEAATATLSVYDVTGKVVTVRNINAIKGLNSEIFTKDQLGVSGVLYYTLVSGDFTATKKMIIVE